MKNRLRNLFSLAVPIALLVAGCGENTQQSARTPITLGQDPVEAIAETLEIAERFDRVESLIAILRAIPADQIDTIPAALDELKRPLREFERVLLISAWSKVDPEAATKWAMVKERNELLRSAMFSETAYAWALKDPESIRTDFKVGMYSLRGWDPTMLRGFIRGWFDSGEPDLESFVRDLGRTGDDRQRAISELVKVKLETETPDELILWATGLDGEMRYRSYVYSRVAADIAVIDPAIAVAWCDEVCDSEVGENMPHWIASSWVREAGAEAMDWIIAQPNSSSVRIGLRASYRRLGLSSPDEADAWLEKFSKEELAKPLLQGPVIMYVNRQSSLSRNDVAIEWTELIQNDWERDRALSTIARRWLRRDADAAEIWLTGTDTLSDVAKADLRKAHREYEQRIAKTREQSETRPAWVVDEMM
ncbi:MAG: hypothetical protein VCB25_06960 [Myxococcota bacterium]